MDGGEDRLTSHDRDSVGARAREGVCQKVRPVVLVHRSHLVKSHGLMVIFKAAFKVI